MEKRQNAASRRATASAYVIFCITVWFLAEVWFLIKKATGIADSENQLLSIIVGAVGFLGGIAYISTPIFLFDAFSKEKKANIEEKGKGGIFSILNPFLIIMIVFAVLALIGLFITKAVDLASEQGVDSGFSDKTIFLAKFSLVLAGIFDLQILFALYSFGIYKYETAEKRGGEAVAKLAFMAAVLSFLCYVVEVYNIFIDFLTYFNRTSAQPLPKLFTNAVAILWAGFIIALHLKRRSILKPKKNKADEAYEQ